ncbi:MAG TPA: cysteine hydrolase [Chloroflexota bacterium]|jgi:biuret amidohydrolase|nr:cysteine hydrolase [Chloroflexota bacterium]
MPHRTPLRMLFPPVPAFPLRDGGAALLVLDFQPFMVDRNVGLGRMAAERGIARELDEYYEQVEYGLKNTADLVQAFRATGMPIIFTRLAAPPSGEVPASFAAYGGRLPAMGSPEAQIVASLLPGGDHADTVLARHTLSPFGSAPLEEILDSMEIGYLVLAGVMTGWSIELTAREAADRGYGVLVASDACPGETYAIHDFVMTQLVGGMIRVRSTGAILQMLAGTRT